MLSPSQQARVAAGSGGVDRRHPLRGEADHVVRTAGLGAGAGEALAAERLAADHRADLVAVDVEVADTGSAFDQPASGVDAAVEPEREAEAGAIDVLDHALEAAGGEARDVQHRAEVLPLEVPDR